MIDAFAVLHSEDFGALRWLSPAVARLSIDQAKPCRYERVSIRTDLSAEIVWMPRAEHFPQTERTWIVSLLAQGIDGVRKAHARVMELYAAPLEIYARSVLRNAADEPRDLVHGFFANRLGRSDYLAKWDPATMRLRRWLMNGLCFYLRERRRSTPDTQPIDAADDLAVDAGLEALVDRAFAAAVVRDAILRGGELCRAQGLADHWRVFEEHHVRERSYVEIAAEFGVSEARLAIMGRTATKRFVEAVRMVLRLDGASESQVTAEVRRLLGQLRDG